MKYIKLFEEIVGETHISDLHTYISRMSMGLDDKMFFVPMVQFDSILDFGCANGILLSEIHKISKSVKLVGYDIDAEMDHEAESKLGNDAIITNDWNVAINSLDGYNSSLLNLSSVIHEVYSYSSSSEINTFWNEVFNSGFKWIVIRDMIVSEDINHIKGFENDARKVIGKMDENLISSFENIWGPINENYKTFQHFLLKYKYVENWDREVRENYLSISLEELKNKIPGGYSIYFEESYVLPFLNEQVNRDFGLHFKHDTHLKMIIKQN